MIKTEKQNMIYIHQYAHATLGWGETKEEAFKLAISMFSDLKWEEIKEFTNMDGECYWSELPEDTP